jgi:hypothetical protein
MNKGNNCWMIRRINKWILKQCYLYFFLSVEFSIDVCVGNLFIRVVASEIDAFIPPLWFSPWLRTFCQKRSKGTLYMTRISFLWVCNQKRKSSRLTCMLRF